MTIKVQPFLKWAGGKRRLMSEIFEILPKDFVEYWEPFCGGAAVFFNLNSNCSRRSHLSDINEELMITYRAIKCDVSSVIEKLQTHAMNHSTEYYKSIRTVKISYTQRLHSYSADVAARMIYLNKTCYNGLYRVNRSGTFNVPIGTPNNKLICDVDNLLGVSEVLQFTSIMPRPFDEVHPEKNDLIYCDPPYDGLFNQYTSQLFNDVDQLRLRDRCKTWRAKGAHVIISNNDTKYIRELYNKKDFELFKIKESRSISCKGNGRKKVSNLLIRAR